MTAYTQSGVLAPGWRSGLVIGVGAVIGGGLGLAGGTLLSRSEQARGETAGALASRADLLESFPLAPPEEVVEDRRPSTLLRADRAVVPFRGRRTDLDRLLTWCLDGTKRVCVLSGPPLVGKTRLVMELAEHLPDGWTAGRLRPGKERGAMAVLRACPGPHLVVVEVGGRRPDLPAFLNDLAAAPDARVRALMVCRNLTWRGAYGSEIVESTQDVLTVAEQVPIELVPTSFPQVVGP